MTDYDITQISVGGQRIGIVGLKPVLEEVAREFAGRPDEEIKAELMARLGKSNYIVPKIKAHAITTTRRAGGVDFRPAAEKTKARQCLQRFVCEANHLVE